MGDPVNPPPPALPAPSPNRRKYPVRRGNPLARMQRLVSAVARVSRAELRPYLEAAIRYSTARRGELAAHLGGELGTGPGAIIDDAGLVRGAARYLHNQWAEQAQPDPVAEGAAVRQWAWLMGQAASLEKQALTLALIEQQGLDRAPYDAAAALEHVPEYSDATTKKE